MFPTILEFPIRFFLLQSGALERSRLVLKYLVPSLEAVFLLTCCFSKYFKEIRNGILSRPFQSPSISRYLLFTTNTVI